MCQEDTERFPGKYSLFRRLQPQTTGTVILMHLYASSAVMIPLLYSPQSGCRLVSSRKSTDQPLQVRPQPHPAQHPVSARGQTQLFWEKHNTRISMYWYCVRYILYLRSCASGRSWATSWNFLLNGPCWIFSFRNSPNLFLNSSNFWQLQHPLAVTSRDQLCKYEEIFVFICFKPAPWSFHLLFPTSSTARKDPSIHK